MEHSENNKLNGIWIGWENEMPTGIDKETYLVVMTARPDNQLDMSKLSAMPLPEENPRLLNIGGVWFSDNNQENNWSDFFKSYNSGDKLENTLEQKFAGVVLDLETAAGNAADINLDELKSFIQHCKKNYSCFVTCMSYETAKYVEDLADTDIDGVIPMLYNGEWTEQYVTNWELAKKGTGAKIIAGIADKYRDNYTFLNDQPSQNGIFVWGIGTGGGEATGEQCQELIREYS